VTELGITIDVSLIQSLKECRRILVTESEITTDSSLEQPEKASTPIHVTEFGISIDMSFSFAFDFSKTLMLPSSVVDMIGYIYTSFR
jgi:hypothetical protein